MTTFEAKASTLALGLCLTFGGSAAADQYADEVEDDSINNASCGGNCQGAASDATGATDNVHATLGDGGSVTLNFTDNTCLVEAGTDVFVDELGLEETYDVQVGQTGVGLDGTVFNAGPGDDNIDVSWTGLAGFNQIKITDTDGNDQSVSEVRGADIDSTSCLNNLDFGTAHIVKANTGPTTIDVGIDSEQCFTFTITISNPLDEDMSDLSFLDVVPAEFDAMVTSALLSGGAGMCNAICAEGGAKGKGKGNQKLAPDRCDIDADVDQGETCTVTIEACTDDDHPGRGNNPDFTPTSCAGGTIVLNEGVQVFDDTSGLLLFIDDDSLELTCQFP